MHGLSNKLVEQRIIVLSQEIEPDSASFIIPSLLVMNNESFDVPIEFYINSPGGDVESGFAIYDVMQMIKAPIKTTCCGQACSLAAILLAAGTKGMRYALPNSSVMIHQVQVEGVEGSGTDVELQIKDIKATKKHMTEILARHTGQTYRKVYRDCEDDKYMKAPEALTYGIIDHILEPTKSIPELIKKKPSKNPAL